MAEERLQKVLAAAGVASRRASEELIQSGRVTVDGRVVTELGTKVDPDQAVIHVDGRPIQLPPRHVYIKLYKPRGILSDIGGDTRGRQTVADLVPDLERRVFTVGRLDLNSEGLVLLTDDGKLAHKLTHPRYEHPKVYYVLVEQRPSEDALRRLARGIDLPDGRTAPAEVAVVDKLPAELHLGPGPKAGVWLRMVLREGKKRQIRHMTAAVDHPTLRLVRWSIGPLTLGTLGVGESAQLSGREVNSLLRTADGGTGSKPPRHAKPKPSGRGRPPRRRR